MFLFKQSHSKMHVYLLFVLIISLFGLRDSTFVTMLRTNDDGNHLFMNCSSSKSPVGNYAEFLVNNRTERILKYFNNQCYSKRGICDKNECSCTPTMYSVNFHVHLKDRYNNFSCQMRFENNEAGHNVVELTTMYNGTELYELQKVIVKTGAKTESTSEKPQSPTVIEKGLSIILPCIIGGTVVVAIIIIGGVLFVKRGKSCLYKTVNTDKPAAQPLLACSDSINNICGMCKKVCICVICSDCQTTYCTICSEIHLQTKPRHNICQMQNVVTSKRVIDCKVCKKNIAEHVCLNCSLVFCSPCFDVTSMLHDEHPIKMLVSTHHHGPRII